MSERPILRFVEATPVNEEGQPMVSIHDPARISNDVMVTVPAFFILTLLDGQHTVEEMCAKFSAHFGESVDSAAVNGLIASLDDALYMDNERFVARKKELRDEFMAASCRPPCLAGLSYSDDPRELAEKLDAMINSRQPENGSKTRAIVVPHIDFRVGGDMMADGWREVKNSDAELYVILGTGHTLTDDFFACLDKDFETPVGTMRVDKVFMESLMNNFGEDIYGSADAHKIEHSIEFQSIFFARLFGDKPEVMAAPILLSFPEMIWSVRHPLFNGQRLNRFIEALKKTVDECGKKVMFVASVDFSHVGARFGDAHALDDAELARIETDDRSLVDKINVADADGFLAKIVEVNQTNRVCGFPPLYTLLKAGGVTEGKLIGYRQNMEGDRESMVSFVSITMS